MSKRTPEHNAKIGASRRAHGVGISPTKRCPRCEQDLPRSAFKHRYNGFSHSYCVPCDKAYAVERQRNYVARTPELAGVRRETNRRVVLRIKYGITLEQYNELMRAQDGVCAICHQSPSQTKRTLAVDHCHSSGAIRGLLCSACNIAIGVMQNDPARLRSAASYLETTRVSPAIVP